MSKSKSHGHCQAFAARRYHDAWDEPVAIPARGAAKTDRPLRPSQRAASIAALKAHAELVNVSMALWEFFNDLAGLCKPPPQHTARHTVLSSGDVALMKAGKTPQRASMAELSTHSGKDHL